MYKMDGVDAQSYVTIKCSGYMQLTNSIKLIVLTRIHHVDIQ